MNFSLLASLYEKMYLIRAFETRLLELFAQGKLFGTIHTYVGQEAVAVSVISQLTPDDVVFTNHRGHGHYLVKEDDPEGLMAEIMGRQTGTCGGRGGSQHLCRNNLYSNGIQGGYIGTAVGMAFAEKRKGSGAVVVAFIGDGTLGEGSVYESLNLASLWGVPLLVVIENNRYAQTTSIEDNLRGSIAARVRAFDISCGEVESNDISVLYPHFTQAIEKVRTSLRPHAEVVHTYRLNAHSKGDDFRAPEEIEQWRARDPLDYARAALGEDLVAHLEERVSERLAVVEQFVDVTPMASS